MTNNDLPPVNPDEMDDKKAPKPGKALKLILFASLVVNLLIIGLVVGAISSRGGHDKAGAPPFRDFGLGPFASVLTDTQRDKFRDEFKTRSGDLRENRKRLEREVVRLIEAMRAEEFDPNTVAQILENQRNNVLRVQEFGHSLFVDALSDLSDEERRALADRIEEKLRKRPKRGDR